MPGAPSMPTRPDPSRARQVELILERVDSLPTLSPVAVRILKLASAEDSELADIARLIEADPAMASRILGLCRRADRGLGDRVTTVRRAVAMLGLESVRASVLSVAIYDVMHHAAAPSAPGFDDAGPTDLAGQSVAFDRVGFWKHSIAVACAAECLAQELPGSRVAPEEAFLAGLIHDLGKLALELILPRSYARVLALADRRQSDSAPIERAVLGLDHFTAGKRIAEHWRLPEALRDVLWFHSQPTASVPATPHRRLIALVTLARSICRTLHLGWSGDFGPLNDPAELCGSAGLEPSVAMTVADPLARAFAERCELLGLDQTPGAAVMLDAVTSANRQLAKLTVSLQTRSKLAKTQARVLDAVRAFQAGVRPVLGVPETLRNVAASASQLLGPGFFAVLYQSSASESPEPAGDEPWQFYQFAPDASGEQRLARSQLIDPPPTRGRAARSLEALVDPSQLSMAAVSILPWLSDELVDAVDMRQVKLMPLSTGATPDGSGAQSMAAVLLHDREMAEFSPAGAVLGPITATWAAAVHAARHQEEARQLSQRLAEVGRSLAEAQERLTASESMARLGEMTAGAAHEMNNPLAVIRGRAELLAARLRETQEHASALAIVGAAQELSDLITSLNLIADPPLARPVPVEIGALARESIAGAAGRVGKAVRVEAQIAPELSIAVLDRELIAPALTELIVNAFEAAPDQIVTLRAYPDPLDDRLIFRVEDRGPGLTPKARQHAFDPFFSQKPAGRQRGLGLTRALRLVQSHGGAVELGTSPSGHGAIATLALPVWRPQTPQRHSAAA